MKSKLRICGLLAAACLMAASAFAQAGPPDPAPATHKTSISVSSFSEGKSPAPTVTASKSVSPADLGGMSVLASAAGQGLGYKPAHGGYPGLVPMWQERGGLTRVLLRQPGYSPMQYRT